MPARTDPLAAFYAELGYTPLNPWWAKAEIVLGLAAAAVGVWLLAQNEPLPGVLLVTLGGYLALAGHRSHLYQSSNRQAAYLAAIVRSSNPPKASS